MQSNYEKGYLVFHLTDAEYNNLNDIVQANNMRVELDAALNEKYITNRQLRLPSASATLRQASPLQSEGGQLQALALEVENYPTIPGFACYRTVEGTFQTAQDIVTNYPSLATWTDVGDSWEKVNGLGGYDMMVLKLTNSAIMGVKPKIFFTSSIHAREYTTAELMTRFAVQMVENYGLDSDTTWMLDHHEVHLMLVTNPDGRKFAETGLLWRKNTNQNYCSPTSNNRGADLNRNFDYQWNCCGGSSGDQCSQTYRGIGTGFGAAPAAEPETQAVMQYLRDNFDDNRLDDVNDAAPLDTMGVYIDIHSSGRLMLWPWGFTSDSAPNGAQLQTFGRKMAFFNGHTPQQSIGLYPTDGTTTSFAYGDLGLPAYTFELGTQFFETCNYFENTLLGDNLPSLFYAVKAARAAYQLPGGPDVINQSTAPTSPTGVPAGTVLTLSAIATDQRFNNSNGTETTQNIVSAEYFIDHLPWEGSSSGSPMSPVDGSFNSGIESIEVSIDTTGLTQGRHMVFIQATDSAGNAGVVSAVFLDIDDNAIIPTSIFSDDFESDKGWITNPSGTNSATTGQWQRADPQDTNSGGPLQLGTTVSGSFDLVTGPLAGTSAGTHDIDSGVTSIRSPNIDVPTLATSVNLSFHYYLAHLNNATSDDFFRTSVIGASSGTTQVLEELGDANQDNASWQQQSIDITGFAGETVYILFEAADAGGGSLVEAAVDDVEITATLDNSPPTNNPPVITNPGNQTNQEGDTNISLAISASDADDDPLIYTESGLPLGLSVNSSTGLISGNLDFNSADTYAVTLSVNDGNGGADSIGFSWTVDNINRAPTFHSLIGDQINDEGDSVNLSAVAADPDIDDDLSYSAPGLPDGISIDTNTGVITGILSATSADSYNINVTVFDGNLTDVQSFLWLVNDINQSPLITYPGNQLNQLFDNVSLTIIASDPDNGDVLTFSESGLPDGLNIDTDTGVITGSINVVGIYNVTISVNDGNGGTDDANFTWTVNDLTNVQETIYVSSTSGGTVGGVSFTDEDILAFDTATATWSIYIDGSDIGLSGSGSRDINAFTILADDSVVFSVVGATSLPDIGSVDDSDLIRFLPTSTGTSTTGSYELYFDGSDVGLSSNGEDIDSVNVLANGNILISTLGSYSVTGASGSDEDLVLFTPTSLGTVTNGTWSAYFDGSDVGLGGVSTEDVYAAWVDDANGDVYLSTRGAYSVTGLSGDGSDIFICTPTSLGTSTSCNYSSFWDGSAFGFGGEIMDGLSIKR